MKNTIFFPVILLILIFPVVSNSQVFSTNLKKETRKDKRWLVPASFGKTPHAFCKPGQQPYVSPEDLYHPPAIKSSPLVEYEPITLHNSDVFSEYSSGNKSYLKDPIGEIEKVDTSTWFSVLELGMLVLLSPGELEY